MFWSGWCRAQRSARAITVTRKALAWLATSAFLAPRNSSVEGQECAFQGKRDRCCSSKGFNLEPQGHL